MVSNYREGNRSGSLIGAYWLPGRDNILIAVYETFISDGEKGCLLMYYDTDFKQWVKIGEEIDKYSFEIKPYYADKEKFTYLMDYYMGPDYMKKFKNLTNAGKGHYFREVTYADGWKKRSEKKVYMEPIFAWAGMKAVEQFRRPYYDIFWSNTGAVSVNKEFKAGKGNIYARTKSGLYSFKVLFDMGQPAAFMGISSGGTKGMSMLEYQETRIAIMTFGDIIK